MYIYINSNLYNWNFQRFNRKGGIKKNISH